MTSTKNRYLTATILMIWLSACQKENQNHSFDITKNDYLNQISQTTTDESAILVDDNATPSRRTLAALPEIADGGMEDREEVTSGISMGNSCIQEPNSCIHTSVGAPVIESVQPGSRVGLKTVQNLNLGTNVVSTYQLPNRTLVNLNANEKTYKLKIRETGSYRVQLAPKYSNRDVDIFVYKLSLVNNAIVRTLVGAGIYGNGATETVDINATSIGYYELVVDAESTVLGNDFYLSVSKLSRIKTTTAWVNNKVQYRFARIISPLENMTQTGWRFRKVGVTAAPQDFSVNTPFVFGCRNCDWLISPLFRNTLTNVVMEDDKEFFKP